MRHHLSSGRRRRRRSLVALAVVVTGLATIAVVNGIAVVRVDAVWTVDGQVGELSQTIPIRAAHPDCPSWSQLGGLVVTTIETDETVILTATFPEQPSDRPCAWMGNPMRATVQLDAPLGDRTLVDGATGRDPATAAVIAFHTGQSPQE